MTTKVSLNDHINSLMTKIAAEKKAESLGSTSFPQPDNGTQAMPEGGTHSDNESLTASTVNSANVAGQANQDPGGMSPEKTQLLTSDDGPEKDPKCGKDQETTSGPKAEDCTAKTSSEKLAEAILSSISKLVSPKTEAKPAAKSKPATKTAEEVVKTAAEKFPEELQAGYEFATKVAEFLSSQVAEQQAVAAPAAKAAMEAENDAVKVAEFLMGLTAQEKLAMDGMADMATVTPEEAMAATGGGDMGAMGGGDMGGGGMGGGDMGGEPSEEEIVQALSQALEAEGISPEELAAAIASEQGGGGEMMADAGAEEAKMASEKLAAARMNVLVGHGRARIAELRKAGHLKTK